MTAASVRRTTFGEHAGLFGRGVAMGLAEVVPGVSGGTIAFITGIYDELVGCLASFSEIGSSWRGGWQRFAERHNLRFLAVLGLGMATGAVGLAHFMLTALTAAPALVSAFFFGLIAASTVHVGASSSWRWLVTLGLLGLAIGLALALLGGVRENAAAPPPTTTLFAGGALAATAWVLPGVSGAFVLVLMGLYRPVLEAFAAFDLALLAPFAAGLALGLLAFSKLVSWLLEKGASGGAGPADRLHGRLALRSLAMARRRSAARISCRRDRPHGRRCGRCRSSGVCGADPALATVAVRQ